MRNARPSTNPKPSSRCGVNADILSVLKRARAKLDDMEKSNATNRRLSGCKAGSPVDRTRSAVTNGLRMKLKELMVDFQGLRQRMMTEYKDTVGRRYFTVTGEFPDDDVIDRIISDGVAEEFLSRAIQEHGRGKVVETVEERREAAKEIEKSLLELHQIFSDMAVMVEAQGEQMDDIEHHVMNAAQYTNDGTKNLKIAKQHHKSSRRCLCIGILLLLLLLLLLILILVIPIAATFGNS